MGNSTSRVVGCFAPFGNGKDAVDLEFLEPLDEGLGHSFCYVRPGILDSPVITPSNSERFMMDSSTLDTETNSGSFRQEIAEDPSGLQKPNKNFSETTFKTISGASVSANASTARTGNPNLLFMSDAQEPAASFESTASFAAIPLQPVPRGSGPLNGFMSGPLERGFASGPLEKGGGFMSGPLERGIFMSGPLDSTDRSNFSAPLAYDRRRVGLGRLMRSMSGPMRNAFSRTFTKHLPDRSWMQRFFQPMIQFMGHSKDAKYHPDASRNCLEVGPSENDYNESRHLQWAHGKAGEDRVHVVLSEEQGWLFVGIYDGFSGPDAPDFLMNNLYRAIDKELEGLLWDYEDKAEKELAGPTSIDSNTTELSIDCATEEPQCPQFPNDSVERNFYDGSVSLKSNELEIGTGSMVDKESVGESAVPKEMVCVDMETNDKNHAGNCSHDCILETCGRNRSAVGTSGAPESDSLCTPTKISGQGSKSLRLFELLQMELMEEYAMDGSLCTSEVGSRRMESFSMQSEDLCSRESLPVAQLVSCSGKKESSGHLGEDSDKRESDGAASGEFNVSKQKVTTSLSISGHKQMIKRSLIGAKLRRIYRKQKSLRKKLFPWNYDWHREQTDVGDRLMDTSVAIRRCKSGPVDHDAVLHAMKRALQTTEEAYMEMVESTLDRNPELALMGSCVLVMLMKDQDVYVMNLGDSRVILAQERPYDRHNNPNIAKDDLRLRNRSRESLARMELDRISEESPMHDPNSKIGNVNKNQEISIYRLRVKALQLSSDHCTGIVEEVMRIKGEHLDDEQAVFNDRVKGQLKVTRAFGAVFLKKPKFNEALLEMFRIDYIGTSPYVSCSPSVLHHRLCSNDRFLVLSSDGLYQYFSNDEVVSHVAWFMENMPEGDPAQYLIAELLFRAAKKNGMDFHELLDIPQGDRRKYHDDVSVMVISLEGRIWRSSG